MVAAATGIKVAAAGSGMPVPSGLAAVVAAGVADGLAVGVRPLGRVADGSGGVGDEGIVGGGALGSRGSAGMLRGLPCACAGCCWGPKLI